MKVSLIKDKEKKIRKAKPVSALKESFIASEARYRRLFENNPVYKANIADINFISENETKVHRNCLKTLIAEDDKISEMLLEIAMRKIGKEVLKAYTGTDAVEICRNNPDIDLVLMDIKMPGIDGYEATRQIRKFNKGMVIIAQTAYANEGEIERAIEVGCNDYISKPFNQIMLFELMKKHFKNF